VLLLDTHALVWLVMDSPKLGDPGDRFIVATALTHGATLMTSDAKIQSMKSVRTVDPTR
jgi:PIN domain nuclease of toxin-antitoxin system